MLMSSSDYRESLRAYRPRVFVQGSQVESVPDDPRLAPGVNAVGVTYDYARSEKYRPIATATQHTSGATVNRFLHVNRTTSDLLAKLEYTRAVCRETGCAMRYLTMDGFNAVFQSTHRIDAEHGTDYHARFVDYLHEAQEQDLTVGIAMTDAKGDRSLRPHEQPNPDAYLRVVERRPGGIVLSGTKAIVTSAPYVHHLLCPPRPQHAGGGRGLRRRVRGPDRRGGPHRRQPAGRAPRRVGGGVLRQVRPDHRGVHLRPGVRALGAGLHVRGMGLRRPPHQDLRGPPPADLHRRARRFRRPPHRRRERS